MRFIPHLMLLGLLLIVPAAIAHAADTPEQGTARSLIIQGDCPVTRPNGSIPPGEGPSPNHHGNGLLWVTIPASGVIGFGDWRIGPDGMMTEKIGWHRGMGALGELTITGRRLDGPAPPLHVGIPDGYGLTGFQVSGIGFPVEGCWEVTGHVDDASLTFVIRIVRH